MAVAEKIRKEVGGLAAFGRLLTYGRSEIRRYWSTTQALSGRSSSSKRIPRALPRALLSRRQKICLMEHSTFEVNAQAHYWTAQAFLPNMIQQNAGHVVRPYQDRNTLAEAVQITIASALSYNGAARMASYSASKAAAMSFHESLRAELIHEFGPSRRRDRTDMYAATMHRTSGPPSSAPASSRPASSTSSTTTPPSSTSSPRPWPRTTSSRISSTPSTPRSRAPSASHTTSTCSGPSGARRPGSGTLSNGWVRCLIMRLRLIFFRAVWQL
jgi:hypothetical protein